MHIARNTQLFMHDNCVHYAHSMPFGRSVVASSGRLWSVVLKSNTAQSDVSDSDSETSPLLSSHLLSCVQYLYVPPMRSDKVSIMTNLQCQYLSGEICHHSDCI